MFRRSGFVIAHGAEFLQLVGKASIEDHGDHQPVIRVNNDLTYNPGDSIQKKYLLSNNRLVNYRVLKLGNAALNTHTINHTSHIRITRNAFLSQGFYIFIIHISMQRYNPMRYTCEKFTLISVLQICQG